MKHKISSLVIDNDRIICRRIMANKFNEYFVNIAGKMNCDAFDDKIECGALPSFELFLNKRCNSSMFLSDCSEDEISEVIKELQTNKSSDIPTLLIKHTSHIIAPHLPRLYNHYMSEGVFPDIFKIGKITPIYKKGNHEFVENYRPVSTLPIFGKIFEKIIHKRLYNFFISKQILPQTQFGFRKGHSTSHALNSSVNIIKDAQKQNKHVLGIFIDLSKAFDTLDHNILLSKLEISGVRGTPLSLLTSYLSNRYQYTSVNGAESQKALVKFGVPQGSVLGPLLFLLYISDMLNCYTGDDFKFIFYADDTNLFVIDINREQAIKKANSILNMVNDYMQSNLLHINLNKCCFIHFEPHTRKNNVENNHDITRVQQSLCINGHVIKEVDETKFLGVTIDKKLSWISHINNLHKKLKSASGIIQKIRQYIPKTQYKTIYHSLFESHLTYGISVWGGVAKVHIDKLFRTQKHCIRLLFGDSELYCSKFKTIDSDVLIPSHVHSVGEQTHGADFYCKEHTKPLFKQHEILTIHNLYKYHTSLEMAKILKHRTPILMHDKFSLSKRNNETLVLLGKHSNEFMFNGPQIWNSAIKVIAPKLSFGNIIINIFKSKLKKHLLEIQSNLDRDTWLPQNFLL